MKDRTEILLVRHAESRPSQHQSEAEWPLSPAGTLQARRLVAALKQLQIDAVFSSPYVRAHATVEPFAKAAGLDVTIVPDLRERHLTEGNRDDWLVILRQAWANLSFSLPNCESGHDCQRRMCTCLAQLASRYAGQTLLVCSHGNAIALYLHALDATFGFDQWAAMQNPDFFWITYEAGRPLWDTSFTLDADIA